MEYASRKLIPGSLGVETATADAIAGATAGRLQCGLLVAPGDRVTGMLLMLVRRSMHVCGSPPEKFLQPVHGRCSVAGRSIAEAVGELGTVACVRIVSEA